MFLADGIAVESGEAGFGEDFAEDFFYFFGAVALEADGGVLALGADAGDDRLVAAEVADEAFFGAVIGDGDGAMGALAGVAAGGTGKGTGKATAVEEEDDLVSGGELLVHGMAQALGENGWTAFLGLVAHVDDANKGEGLTVGSLGEGDELVFVFGAGVEVAFDGRSGGAKDDSGAFDMGANDGEVAAVVFRWVLLFVSGLVLFVDEDEAEVGEGGEDGGAGSDDDFGNPFADAVPLVEAFALGEGGVEDGDEFGGLAKAGLEALYGLGSERDFGKENDDGFAGFEGRLGGLEVDFGFARAGDAVEENGFSFGVGCLGVEVGRDFFESDGLFGIECLFGIVEESLVGVGVALNGDVLEGEEVFLGKAFDRTASTFAELGDGHAFLSGGLEEGEDGVLAGGALGEFFEDFGVDVFGGDGLFDGFFGVVFLAHRFGEKRAHDVFERGAVVAGHPVGEFEEARGDKWVGVDEGFERAEVELHFLGFVDTEDSAGGGAVAQGDADAMTGHDFEPLGDGVVEDEFGRTVDEDLGGGHLGELGWNVWEE